MNRKRKALLVFVPAILIILLLLVVALPSYIRARKQSQRNACLNNLQQIECPLTCCMPLEKGLAEGDTIDLKEFSQYMMKGTIPICPGGGEYIISYIVGGPYPRCTVHGNLLQEVYGDRTLGEGIRRKTETKKEYEKRMTELTEKFNKDHQTVSDYRRLWRAQPEPDR